MRLPRFYPIIDTSFLAKRGIEPEQMAQSLAAAGVQIAQFRHKGPYTRDVLAQAERVGRIIQEAGATYVVNDRADIALMAGAVAVHIGQDDLPPEAVRRMVGSEVAVGFSTHNEQQLRSGDQEPVDYLAFGPVFGTASKENADPTVGVEELARLRPLTRKPLVAIGGITRVNVRQVFEAGADSVAVISDLVSDDLPGRIAEWLELTTP
jgi:thiamine-phosphate pyrophosphorylase